MGFDADDKPLGHKPCHSEGRWNRYGNLYDLARSSTSEALERQRFRQWELDPRDPHSLEVARRLTRAWRSWSDHDRRLLLDTAEAIASAERAKLNWNPKALRGAYRRLVRASVNAFKEAHKLAERVPPPWEGDRAGVGALVRRLVKFGKDVLNETTLEGNLAFWEAARLIQQLKRKASRHRRPMRWELLRDLAWLASGKTLSDGFSERTVRRYLERRRRFLPPGYQMWEQHWTLMRDVSRLASRAV